MTAVDDVYVKPVKWALQRVRKQSSLVFSFGRYIPVRLRH